MWFLILGVVLLVLKIAEFGPFADLGWVWVLAPFGLAVTWWAFSDSSGLTQRRAMEKMAARQRERRERDMKALGLDVRRETRVRVMRDAAARRNPPPPPPPPPAAPPPRRDPRL